MDSMNLRELNHRKNEYLRSLRGQVARWLLDKKAPAVFTPQAAAHFKQIVFLRNDNKLGDLLISQLAYRELKKKLPQVKITVIAGENSAQLLRENPHVDRVLICKKGVLSAWKVASKLRREKVDLFIDLDRKNTATTLLLLRRLAPAYAVGFNREDVKLYNITTAFNFDDYPVASWYGRLFELLGLGPIDTSYELFIPAQAQARAQAFLATSHRPVVALNLYAASKHRCLSFLQANTLAQAFPHVMFVLIGKASSVKPGGPANLVAVPQSFTLFDSLAVVKYSDLLVSPDTMWVHAACALNKPQLAIFKQSDPANQRVWAPRNSETVVVQAPDEFSELSAQYLVDSLKAKLHNLPQRA